MQCPRGDEQTVPGQARAVERLEPLLAGVRIEGVELAADPITHCEQLALRE